MIDDLARIISDALPPPLCPRGQAFALGLLRGDRAKALPAGPGPRESAWARAAMGRLTELYRLGHIPFCQLTAAAQVAAAAYCNNASVHAVIGAVAGDTSGIGKAHMRMMLSAWGIACLDLGVDVAPWRFLQAAREHEARFVLCSSFGDASGEQILALNAQARSGGLRDSFRLLVGGAAMTGEQLALIGADALDTDAALAARQVARWMEA